MRGLVCAGRFLEVKRPSPSTRSLHRSPAPAFFRFRGTQGGGFSVVGSTADDDHGPGKQDVGLRSTVAEKEEPHEKGDDCHEKESGNGSSPVEGNGAMKPKPAQLAALREGALSLKQKVKNNKSVEVVKNCGRLLSEQIWPVLCLTVLNSAARFALCWGLYKTVAAVAIMFFGVPASSIPQHMLPPVGGEGDSAVYTRLADITFLLFKPLDYLVKGVFLAALLMACTNSAAPSRTTARKLKLFSPRRVWGDFCRTVGQLWLAMKSSPNIILVHILVGALTAAYQGLCLMIIPFLFASRRLLNIQLALYLAAIKGEKGRSALNRSKDLVEPIRPTLYLPYILLFAAPKFFGAVQDKFFQVVPGRLFAEVPELTWSCVLIMSGSAFLLDRMLEILPVVVYASTSSSKNSDA